MHRSSILDNWSIMFLDLYGAHDPTKSVEGIVTEKIHIITCIFSGTRLHQSVGKEGH